MHLSTNSAPWLAYLTNHFGDHFSLTSSAGNPHISVTASWYRQGWCDPSLVTERSERFPVRIGGSIVRSDHEVCWIQKLRGRRLKLVSHWDDDRLVVEGVFQQKIPKDKIKVWLGASESQRLFELTYQLVYYPLWYYLELLGGWHIMHASAVRMDDAVVVFPGLEGIGKTTLALACMASGGELISDNMLWYNGHTIMGVPEPIRLHDSTKTLLQDVSLHALSIGSAHKGFFEVSEVLAEAQAPQAVLLPAFGERTEIVPLEPDVCAAKILASNQLVGEIEGYHPYAAWMSFLRPIHGLDAHRHQRLLTLLRGASCGLLHMQKNNNVEQVVSQVRQWLDGLDHSAVAVSRPVNHTEEA